jgi:Fe-S cluster assembly protein SufD
MAITASAPFTISGTEALQHQGPAWLQSQRKAALEAYKNQPFPTMRDELWRKTDPERVRPDGLAALKPRSAFEGAVPAGFVFGDIAQHIDAAESVFYAQAKTDSKNLFINLNGAVWQGGTYLSVAKDSTSGEQALFASHNFDKPGLAATRTAITVGRHSVATLVESFDCGDHAVVAAPVSEVVVEEGANFRYIIVNQWGPNANVVPIVHARIGKDANLQVLFVGFGTALTKCFVECDLVGEGSKSEVLGMVLGQGRQHYDIDIQQNHRVGSTVSDVLVHVALTDRARSVFAGNILCEPGSQKIDGYQQNRNLLLSDTCRADSMPRLEIEANDVRCTHGASFSTYNDDQLFYLQSRGMNIAEAEQLLVMGFFQAVSERINLEVIHDWLAPKLQAKMASALQQGPASRKAR